MPEWHSALQSVNDALVWCQRSLSCSQAVFVAQAASRGHAQQDWALCQQVSELYCATHPAVAAKTPTRSISLASPPSLPCLHRSGTFYPTPRPDWSIDLTVLWTVVLRTLVDKIVCFYTQSVRCENWNTHSGPLKFQMQGEGLCYDGSLWIEVNGKWMEVGLKSLQRQLSNPVWVCGGQRGSARPAICHFRGQWAHWSPGSCWSGLVSVWQVINRAEDWALMPLAALPCRITELDTHLHWPCSMCVTAIVFYFPKVLHPTQTGNVQKKKKKVFFSWPSFLSPVSCSLVFDLLSFSHPHNSFISLSDISFALISPLVVKYIFLYSPLCKLNFLEVNNSTWEPQGHTSSANTL